MHCNAKFFVRPAVDADIPIIEGWLAQHPDVESLAVNWKTTLHVYKTRGMLVMEDIPAMGPIAYFWGNLAGHDSVLEVRYERRGQGAGKAFVEYLIDQASNEDRHELLVECAPHTSQNFWCRMGFDIEREGHRCYGRRRLR